MTNTSDRFIYAKILIKWQVKEAGDVQGKISIPEGELLRLIGLECTRIIPPDSWQKTAAPRHGQFLIDAEAPPEALLEFEFRNAKHNIKWGKLIKCRYKRLKDGFNKVIVECW